MFFPVPQLLMDCLHTGLCVFIFLFKEQNERREKKRKKASEKQGVQFVLTNHFSTWGLPWGMVDKFIVIPLEKTDFSSLYNYHL